MFYCWDLPFFRIPLRMAHVSRIGAVLFRLYDDSKQMQNYEIFLKLDAFCLIILNRCIIFAPYSLEKSATIFLYMLYILVRET